MNKFLKVVTEAARDRGVDLAVGRGDEPSWAAITTGYDDDRVTVEVVFHDSINGDEYYTVDVYEWTDDTTELLHAEFGHTTASLSRLLTTWLG